MSLRTVALLYLLAITGCTRQYENETFDVKCPTLDSFSVTVRDDGSITDSQGRHIRVPDTCVWTQVK